MSSSKVGYCTLLIVLNIILLLTAFYAGFTYYEECYKSNSSLESNIPCSTYDLVFFNINIKPKDAPKDCNIRTDQFKIIRTNFISGDSKNIGIYCDINCHDGSWNEYKWVDIRYNASNDYVYTTFSEFPILYLFNARVGNIGVYECCSINDETDDTRYKRVHYIYYRHFSGQIDVNEVTDNRINVSSGDLLFMVEFEYAFDELIWYWINSRDVQHEIYNEINNDGSKYQYLKKKELYLDVYENATRNGNNTRVRSILKITPLGHKNSVIKFIVKSCLSMSENTLFQHTLAN